MKNQTRDEIVLYALILIGVIYFAFFKDNDVYQGCGDMDRSAKCETWGALR
jgi:hypothetical protein